MPGWSLISFMTSSWPLQIGSASIPFSTSSIIRWPGNNKNFPRSSEQETRIREFVGCLLCQEIWCGENLIMFPFATLKNHGKTRAKTLSNIEEKHPLNIVGSYWKLGNSWLTWLIGIRSKWFLFHCWIKGCKRGQDQVFPAPNFLAQKTSYKFLDPRFLFRWTRKIFIISWSTDHGTCWKRNLSRTNLQRSNRSHEWN